MVKIKENPLAVKSGDIFIEKSTPVTCYPLSHIVLLHREGIAPTKQEIKQVIIQRILDIEYAPGNDFWKDDRETWDMERQMLVLRCGLNKMSAEELLASLSEG